MDALQSSTERGMSISQRLSFLVVFAGLLPFSASAGGPDATCATWAQEIVEGDADACSDLCPQASRFDQYDYRNGLAAAFGSTQGLDRFLNYLDRSTIIGAGAEGHACAVRALLEHWGDNMFARSLSHQGPHAKDQAIGLLDYTAIPDFQKRYPRTYMLAEHE